MIEINLIDHFFRNNSEKSSRDLLLNYIFKQLVRSQLYPSKLIIYLNEVEEIIDMSKQDLSSVSIPLFQRLSKCIHNDHF